MAKYRIDIQDKNQPGLCVTTYTNSYKNRIPHLRQLILQGDTRFHALAQTPQHRIQFRVISNTPTICIEKM